MTPREARRLYGSVRWRETADAMRRAAADRCARCATRREGLHVHHSRVKVLDLAPDDPFVFDPSNLVVLCGPCHRAAERYGADLGV